MGDNGKRIGGSIDGKIKPKECTRCWRDGKSVDPLLGSIEITDIRTCGYLTRKAAAAAGAGAAAVLTKETSPSSSSSSSSRGGRFPFHSSQQ